MKRIGVLTSGGDAPGMNAALRAVVRTGLSLDMEVYGIQHGFEGLLEGEIEEMKWSSVGEILHRGEDVRDRGTRHYRRQWILYRRARAGGTGHYRHGRAGHHRQ